MILKVLALDVASTTGWAFGQIGSKDPIAWGHIELAWEGANRGLKGVALEDFLFAKIRELQPDRVVTEAPIKRRIDTMAKLRLLYGLLFECQKICCRLNIEWDEHDAHDVRNYFFNNLSRGDAKAKDVVMRMCRIRGWTPAQDDEADAMALLDYDLARLSPKHALRVTPMFSQQEEEKGQCRIRKATTSGTPGRIKSSRR